MNSMIEEKRDLLPSKKLRHMNSQSEVGKETSIKKQEINSLIKASFTSNDMVCDISGNSTFVNRKYNQTEFDIKIQNKRKQTEIIHQRKGSYVES